MAGLDLSSLSGLTSNLTALVPSSTDILNQVALGAASGVVLAGLKSQISNGALDPLGLFSHPAAPVAPAPPVAAPTSTTTIAASAFVALPPATQAQLQMAGVHIVAG